MSVTEKQERIVTVRDKGRITIPAGWRETYGLDEGSELIVVAEEGRLVLYPRRNPRLEELLDRLGAALQARGISLDELLSSSSEMRLQAFREKYPELSHEHGL